MRAGRWMGLVCSTPAAAVTSGSAPPTAAGAARRRGLRARGLLWRGGRAAGAAAVPRPDVLGEGVVRQRQVLRRIRRPVVRDGAGAAALRASDVVHARAPPPAAPVCVSAGMVRRGDWKRCGCGETLWKHGVCEGGAALRPRVERKLRGAAASKCPAHGTGRGAVQVRHGWSGECREEALPGQLLRLGRCVDGYCECDAVTVHGEHIQLSGKSCTEAHRGAICAGCAAPGGAAGSAASMSCARERVHHRLDRPAAGDGVASDRPLQLRRDDGATEGEEEQGIYTSAPRGRGPGAPLPQPPPGGRPPLGAPVSQLRLCCDEGVRRWLHLPVLPHVRGGRCRCGHGACRARHVRVRGGWGGPGCAMQCAQNATSFNSTKKCLDHGKLQIVNGKREMAPGGGKDCCRPACPRGDR